MDDKQGFVRLNPVQKHVLELIKPFVGDEDFFVNVRDGNIGDMSFKRLMPVLWELQALGYLSVLKDDYGLPYGVALSSCAFCYRHEYLVNICIPALVRGLAGVSGGLVVWLLTRFVGA